MLYKWKVNVLKTHRGNRLYWRWRRRKGDDIGNYARLSEYIRSYAPRHSFADIGCMWGVNGEYSFLAEEAGATVVKGVDVFGPTPEFEEKRRRAIPRLSSSSETSPVERRSSRSAASMSCSAPGCSITTRAPSTCSRLFVRSADAR